MSAAIEREADASTEAEAPASPFIMVTGDPDAMVCEDDVCFVPGPTR